MIETKISLDYEGVLELGRAGEEEARCFIFDLSGWMEHFAEGGKVSLLARRSWEQASYPCTIATNGNTAVWTVRSGDVAVPGKNGCAELRYEVDGSVVLSKVWPTEVGESLVDPSGPAPDPAQPWVDEVLQAADRAESAADEAAEACGIFVAEYGVTKWEELKAAYDAGKYIVVNCSGYLYGLYYMSSTYMEFRHPGTGNTPYCRCFSISTWQTGNFATTANPFGHASRHAKDGNDPITPESIGAIPALGESISDPETNIDDLFLTKNYLCGSTVIKNGLRGDLPWPSSFALKVEDFTGTGTRTAHIAFRNSGTAPAVKWRFWTGHVWTSWQDPASKIAALEKRVAELEVRIAGAEG